MNWPSTAEPCARPFAAEVRALLAVLGRRGARDGEAVIRAVSSAAVSTCPAGRCSRRSTGAVGYGFDIVLVAALALTNAVFAGGEMALISLREGQLRALERDGGRGAPTLVRLARDPNRFPATIQIGIALAGFLASATAAVSQAQPLVPLLGFLGGAANAVAVALVTIVLTLLTLVFGELAPKRPAMQHAQGRALLVVRPLDLLSTISRPVVWTLSAGTNVVVRVFGGTPTRATRT